MPVTAPWLQTNPRDVVQAAERGASLGLASRSERNQTALASARLAQSAQAEQQQIALAHQRLQQEQEQVKMQMEMRRQLEERNFMLAQQRNEIAKAYHEATSGIQQQRLEQAAKAAATKAAAQQKLSALTSSGVPFDQAILQVPELLGAGAETAMTKAALGGTRTGSQKMNDIDRLRYSAAEKELAAGEKEGPTKTGMWPFRTEHPNPRAESAKKVMAEIEQKYGQAVPAGGAAPGITHVFDASSGSLKPVTNQPAQPVPTQNTYGGVSANEHFQEAQ